MKNLHNTNEEIGIVQWFGDSTKEGSQSNYGYIERIEKPGTKDIKVYWKGLNCPIDEIKGQKGLLVKFQIGKFRDKEEAVNVQPIRVPGYVDKLSYLTYRAVIDTSITIAQRVGEIVAQNIQAQLEENLYNPLGLSKSPDYFFTSLQINTRQLSCLELSLFSKPAVYFGIRKSYKINQYEAVRLSLLKNEENQAALEYCIHSQNPIIWQTAFKKYLSLLPDNEAIKFAIQKINDFSLNLSISRDIFSNRLLTLDEAKPLRDKLPLKQRLQLSLEMVSSSEENTNQKLLDELFSIAQKIAEDEKHTNYPSWQSIPENLISNKVTYNGFLWGLIPDTVKYKVAAKYLQNRSDDEAIKIANYTIISLVLEKDKIDFLNLISENLKSRLDARILRELLPVESRLVIYQKMVNDYEISEIIAHNVEEEIISILTTLATYKRELWLTSNVESKVVYKGFLWKIAPERVKRRVIENKFSIFLTAIKTFYSGYTHEKNITASAKDIYPQLDIKDKQLAQKWISLEDKNDTNTLARMLSARAAEKFAITVYQFFNYQVEDVSLQQIFSNNRDWRNYDLLLNNSISVDVKNSRTSVSKKNRYSEFCIPNFKRDRSNEEVIIAGVFSPYLQQEYIEYPERANFHIPKLIFMGEMRKSELDILEKHFAKYFYSIQIPRNSSEKYLPPWLFDYPVKTFYAQQEKAISDLRELALSKFPELEDIQLLNLNPFPLCLAAKVSLPEQWITSLTDWEQRFILTLQQIPTKKITLPYLFLTILSHFIDMLRLDDNSFHPSKYSKLLYCTDSQSHPLGIYDPLDTISELCETLSILWENRYQSRINEFKIFKFNGSGLLEGKRNINEQLTTIIAYCGGYIEKKGKCGFTPLVLGKHDSCPNCGKLRCPHCDYCTKHCQHRIQRQLTA
ncbi:hypothetical protein SAMD00079811_72240 [Scytonema sp. HK-05]|nr:hypothetical protein NIES2130_35700 [Scytonema sp. HK-05]BAY49595.1 hypothetical protein SAMD00079811_72240 [Scytonema sp. HK-05]